MVPRHVVLLLAALPAGCHRNDDERARAKHEFERVKAAYEKRVAELRANAPPATPAPATVAAGSAEPNVTPPERRAATDPSSALPERDAPWVADVAVELAAPAQATATSRGVVVNTRDGDVVVARLGRLSRAPAATKTPLEPLPPSSGNFGLGYGPSVAPDAVYWISHGSLVRRQWPAHGPPGPLEVLARDAFDGTRVAVPVPVPGKPLPPIPRTVAYVVRPEKEDAPLLAKLWVEGQEAQVLTAEGNSTHSVSLVHTDDGVLALSVQARMAMTPVHARRVRFPSRPRAPARRALAENPGPSFQVVHKYRPVLHRGGRRPRAPGRCRSDREPSSSGCPSSARGRCRGARCRTRSSSARAG